MKNVKKDRISVPDYNDCFVRYIFSGKLYNLRFSWNDYEKRWYFGIFNSFREPLIQGIKIVPNYPLNMFSGIDELYNGFFIATTDRDEVGRDDFLNGKASFFYVSVK